MVRSDVEIIGESFVDRALLAANNLEVAIQNATTLTELNGLTDKAIGEHKRLFRQKWSGAIEAANRFGEVWCLAEIKRYAEYFVVMRPGTRGQLKTAGPGRGKKGKTGTQKKLAPVLPGITADDIGLSEHERARGKQLDKIGESEIHRIAKVLQSTADPVNPNSVLAYKRSENVANKTHELQESEFSEDGPFDVVVIDPPWPMQKIDRDTVPTQDAFEYPTMTEDELVKFWRLEVEPKLKDDAHVFSWTTQKFLPMQLRLLDQWSLKYVLLMVWHKAGGFQPFGLPQYNCEFIIYARRGAPVFTTTKDFMCCFDAPRREHSRKPDLFYDVVRRVTGGSRVDIFAREKRDGFATFGNQAGKFDGVG